MSLFTFSEVIASRSISVEFMHQDTSYIVRRKRVGQKNIELNGVTGSLTTAAIEVVLCSIKNRLRQIRRTNYVQVSPLKPSVVVNFQ